MASLIFPVFHLHTAALRWFVDDEELQIPQAFRHRDFGGEPRHRREVPHPLPSTSITPDIHCRLVRSVLVW
jgi:hypothetical protein